MKVKEAVQTLRSEGYSMQQIGNYAEKGYRELMDLVYTKLSSMGGRDVYYYLEELYEDYLIYSKSNEPEPNKMYKQAYKFTDGKVEFVGDAVEVRKDVKFVVMKKSSEKMVRTKFSKNVSVNQKQEVKMKNEKEPCCEDLVDELIANKRTKYDADDKDWLLTLEEAQLGKMIPEKEKEPEVKVIPEANKVAEVKTPEKVVEALSDEDKAALAYGHKQLKARRDTMIKGIQDNAGKEIWPDEKLNAFDEDTLQRVFDSVRKDEVVDYSLNGNTELTSNQEDHLFPAGIEMETK